MAWFYFSLIWIMLLKEALEYHKQNKGQVDILEILDIKIKKDYFNEKFYLNTLKNLPKGKYFISDLDGTFFRGFLIKEAFSLFTKYIRNLDIEKIDLKKYQEFLEDFKFFKILEKQAYNKQIDYTEYLNAGMFLIYKHHTQVNWADFLSYLKEYFYRHEKVKPFRFSLKKMKEILESDVYFLFVSGSSAFVFDIYLDLLKKYICELFGKSKAKKIYGFSAYANLKKKYIYNLHSASQKFEFIQGLKEKGLFTEIIGGMGDTIGDYGISNHLEKGKKFYFVNPIYQVITDHNKYKKQGVKFQFITERKDLIFEYNLAHIKII